MDCEEAGLTCSLRRMLPDLADKLGYGAPVALDPGGIEGLDVVGGFDGVGLFRSEVVMRSARLRRARICAATPRKGEGGLVILGG